MPFQRRTNMRTRLILIAAILTTGSAMAQDAGNTAGPGVNLQQVALMKWFPTYAGPSLAIGVGYLPQALAFDGTSMWITNYGNYSVTKLRTSDLSSTTFSILQTPTGVAFDGARIWVPDQADGVVSVFNASDGSVQ